jgi:methionyl-tRNA synthetase
VIMDRADPTRALDLIWKRVRRLNRYVEERAPWELARDPQSADRLDETLASLAEGLRVLSVLLHPYMPQTTGRLLETIGAPAVELRAAVFSEQGSGATVAELQPLFPKR